MTTLELITIIITLPIVIVTCVITLPFVWLTLVTLFKEVIGWVKKLLSERKVVNEKAKH